MKIKNFYEIDLLTILNTIWNIALAFHFNQTNFHKEWYQYSRIDVTNEEKEITDEEFQKIKKLKQFPFVEFQNFKELLSVLNKLSVKLNNVAEKANKPKLNLEDNTYLKKSAIIDIYSTTLMAVVVSYSSCCEYGKQIIQLSNSELDNINSIISSSNSVASYQIPEIDEGADLIQNAKFQTKINSLTRLCIITWRGLDLDNLANNLSLKGIYFNVITGHYKETQSCKSK